MEDARKGNAKEGQIIGFSMKLACQESLHVLFGIFEPRLKETKNQASSGEPF